MQPLVNADASALAITYLTGHADVIAEIGSAGVWGTNRPPYPRLVVTDPPGDDRYGRWVIAPILQVEALGDLDGTPGKAALRRILYTAIGVLVAWPDQPTVGGQPVVTAVVPVTGGGWSPLPSGQPRYVATLRCTLHPAAA